MITAIVSVFNEEKRIKYFLESFSWVEKIIIVDKNSSDKTIELSNAFKNVEIITLQNKLEYNSLEVSIPLKKVSTDWVVFLTASDLMHPKLSRKIQEVLPLLKKYDSINIPYKPFFQGYNGKGSPWHASRINKIVKTEKVVINKNSVHNAISFNITNTYYLKCLDKNVALYHFTHESFKSILERHNRYLLSEMKTDTKLNQLLFKIIKDFFKILIRTRIFTSSNKVIALNLTHFSYYLLKFNAIHERENGNSIEDYQSLKQKILSDNEEGNHSSKKS